MKRNSVNKFFMYALVIFLLIQPIFDLKYFYNSISTLIRVIIIGVFFCYYFFVSNNKRKYWLLIYPIILGIYFVFHNLNANNFRSVVPGNFNYSTIQETLYLIKMVTPFLLIYVIFESELAKRDILNIIKILTCIISLIIIITNILCISYGSYSDEKIKANLFSWFTKNEFVYQELASKGLFEYANQISAILIMFLTFNILETIEDKKIKNIFVLVVNILGLFLLGTKVSVLGIILVFAYTLIANILNKKINGKKYIKKSLSIVSILFVCYLLVLSYNPIFMRMDETKTIEAVKNVEVVETIENENTIIQNNVIEENKITKEDEEKSIEANIRNICKDKQLKEEFVLDAYPYKYDSEFWLKIFNEPLSKRVDFRYIETSMVKRVLEINNNKCDTLFGITNTRVQNIFNIERDFIVQYYALGIIGSIIIFVPYLLLLGIFVKKVICNKCKNIDTTQIISFITILLMFAIAYYTGNLLNSLSFTIYLTLLFGLLLKGNLSNNVE